MRTVTRMVWLVVLVLAGVQASWAVMGYCNVKSFGAKGDGVTNDTAAIQKALDSCGSGKAPFGIAFPPGVYISGPLVVRSNTVGNMPRQEQWLELGKGAVLRASTRRNDYKLPPNSDEVEPLLRVVGGSARIYGGGVIQSVGLKWQPSPQGASGKGIDDPNLHRPAGTGGEWRLCAGGECSV